MQWSGKGVNLIRRQKSQGHVGLNMYITGRPSSWTLYATVIYSNEKKTTDVPTVWKILLYNINETQLKVANYVVGIYAFKSHPYA